MPSYNYPKTSLEGYDIELCNIRDKTTKLKNFSSAYFPTYSIAALPETLVDGQAFCAEEGKFCIYYDGSIYCMPAAPPFPPYATIAYMLTTDMRLGVYGDWGAFMASTSSFTPGTVSSVNWDPHGGYVFYHQAFKRGDYSKVLLSGFPSGQPVVIEQSGSGFSGSGPVVASTTIESPWSLFQAPAAVELPDGSFRMVAPVVSSEVVHTSMGTVPPGALPVTYHSHPWQLRVYDLPDGSYTVAGEGLSIINITAPDDTVVHSEVNTYPIFSPWFSPDGNHFGWYRLNLKEDLSDPADRLSPGSNVRNLMLYSHSTGSSINLQTYGSDLPYPEWESAKGTYPSMIRWSPVGNHYVLEVQYANADGTTATVNYESSLYGTIFSGTTGPIAGSSQATPLTVVFYEAFRFSPDGQHIAWLRWDHSEPAGINYLDYYNVWIMDKDGANKRKLSDEPLGGVRYNAVVGFHGIQPSIDWSPDGTQICVWVGYDTETGPGSSNTVYIFDVATGHLYPVMSAPGWSTGFKVHSWQWGP